MESIVHYKRLLLRNPFATLDAGTIVNECRQLLLQLQDIDHARRKRYEEIGQSEIYLRPSYGS